MIRVYCVLLVGEPFLLENDRESVEHGFYRNEYVLAASEEKAISVAKVNTMKKFARNHMKMVDGHPFELKVEKITSGIPFWRLFRNEGFLFFPVDS